MQFNEFLKGFIGKINFVRRKRLLGYYLETSSVLRFDYLRSAGVIKWDSEV